MKKIARTAILAVFALAVTLGLTAAASTDAQAATKKSVKSVSITSPVTVSSGEKGEYTLYQEKGKPAEKTIKAKISVTGGASKTIYYKSSNPSVLTVGKTSGTIKSNGNETGSATITAYAKDNPDVKAKLKVKVRNFKPVLTSTGLDNLRYTGKEEVQGSVAVQCKGLKHVSYKSGNKSVLKIGKKGKVYVKGVGTATFTAKAKAESGLIIILEKTVTVKDGNLIPSYSRQNFDFGGSIKTEFKNVNLVPAAPKAADDLPFTISDDQGATGVTVVRATAQGDESYYLNALVKGHTLRVAPKTGYIIQAVTSSVGTQAYRDGSGDFVLLPKTPTVGQDGKVTGETLTVRVNDRDYLINTVNDCMPGIQITNASTFHQGVYTFTVDRFLLRVNTQGEVVYYRSMLCAGDMMIENLQKQGSYYTYFVELRREYRNVNGGFSSGMYVVMDSNYRDIDYVTLSANSDPNHSHGEGYLDQHEFVVLGSNHYLTLSYTPLRVTNIPASLGTTTGYVWAGIFQEVKDGKVIHEINTTDYPLLYQSAVEKIDYKGSTDKGTIVDMNGVKVPSAADGWQDYVHPNSLDYTLKADGTVDRLLVSMRDQCAVYQFNMSTGAIDWILGGKASTLHGYEAYTTKRVDEGIGAAKVTFDALTYGQHYARYTNRGADGTISGNPQISIFDNQTGTAPFLSVATGPNTYPTNTRTFKVTINPAQKTAAVSDVIYGLTMNGQTGKYHNSSHCGSVEYQAADSVVIGWGLHGVADSLPPKEVTIPNRLSDPSFGELYMGSRPIVTEYNPTYGTVTFELSVTRNANVQTNEALFSYRAYKTAD